MSAVDRSAAQGRRILLRRCAGGFAFAIAAAANVAFAADAGISIDNFKFSPTPLTVKPGTTVTWTNRDDIPHSIVVPSLNLHSHPIDTDETFAHRFDQAGTFDYVCGMHPFMRGTVIVRR
jgi:plastocyanin